MNQPTVDWDRHFAAITIGPLRLWLSYDTLIAFEAPGIGLVVSQNIWGRTTGKHICQVSRKARLERNEFLRLWDELQMTLHHPLIDLAKEEGRCPE